MKKLTAGITVTALVIFMCSMTALAAGYGGGRSFADADQDFVCNYCNTSCQFTDSDGDGICDNCGLGVHGTCAGYIDADEDGICDNYASFICATGAGYVDADEDGVCDNYEAGRPRNGRCYGQGRGCGRGYGQGRGCGQGRCGRSF